MTDNKQTPVFIISAGRSGSTFLARLVDAHPDMTCVSDLFEPVGPAPFFTRNHTLSGKAFFETMLAVPSTKPRLRYWKERQTKERLFKTDDERMVSLLMSYTIPFLEKDPLRCFEECRTFFASRPDKTPADHLVDFFDWMRVRHGGKIWVERTGGALLLTPCITQTWPNAKIIHNFRDGRESAISMWNYPFFRMYLRMQDEPDLDEWDFDYMPPVEQMGQMWSEWIAVAEDAMDKLPPAQQYRLSYEDLLADPRQALAGLVCYIFDRMEPNETDLLWIEECSKKMKPSEIKFHALSEREQRVLEKACEPGMRRLGYIA